MKKIAIATFVGLAAAVLAPQFAMAQDPVAGAVTGVANGVNTVATGAGKAVTGVLDQVTGQHSAPAAADVAADDSGAAELDPESDDPDEQAARSRAPAAMAGIRRRMNPLFVDDIGVASLA